MKGSPAPPYRCPAESMPVVEKAVSAYMYDHDLAHAVEAAHKAATASGHFPGSNKHSKQHPTDSKNPKSKSGPSLTSMFKGETLKETIKEKVAQAKQVGT